MNNEMQIIALLLGGLFMVVFSFAGLFGLFAAGSLVRSGEIDDPVYAAQNVAIYVWVFSAGLSSYLIYIKGLKPDNLDGLLTTVSHRDVIGGLLGAELIVWSIPTVGYGLLGSVAFAIGARSIIPIPFVLVSLWSVVGIGLFSGFLIALTVKNSGVRSKLLTRLRTILLVGLGIGYIWVMITGAFGSILAPLNRLLLPTPLSWYGDFALLGSRTEVSLVRALGSLLITGGIIGLGLPVLSRLAEWYWYVDPVRVDQGATRGRESRVTSRFTSIFSPPVRGVISVDWIRARRSPITLSFVLYPLIVLIDPIRATIEVGAVTGSLPLWIALCGAWITGSLFTLNVLGNEGGVLPVTILGISSGRTLVFGHVIAGAIVGVPVTVLLTVGLALVSPLPPMSVVTVGATALVLAACAGPIASGVGAAFPRFEAVSVSRSREAVVPSIIGFVVYSIVLIATAAPSALAHSRFLTDIVSGIVGIPPGTIPFVGVTLSSIGGLGIGYLSVRFATHEIETFRIDD